MSRDQAEEFFHLLERGAEGSGLTSNWYKAFYSMYGIDSIGDLMSFLFRISAKYPNIKSNYYESSIKDLVLNKYDSLSYVIGAYFY